MQDQPDVLRQQFWDALRGNGSARVEDFLERVDESERAGMFRDFVMMEISYCRQRGTRFDQASLGQRFPQFSNVLEEVCRTDADSANESFQSTIAFKRSVSLPDDGDELKAAPAQPQRAGRYRLDQIVGRGSFGEVWKAHDPDLDRVVAVKIPRGDRQFSPEMLQSFLAEARCVAKLRIPGVVSVYDVGQEGSSYYIVSDFVDGETLADRIKRERLSWQDSALLLAGVAETLHRAHLKDLVHRDIKPNNILLDRDGRAFVADFGLAVSEGEQLREFPSVLGTFAYMSPEQARGDSNRVDGRSDIYSLGVILYQLLTNRLPFLGATPGEYLQQIQHRDARPPRTVDDSIPMELERICLKCLAKSPTDRYSTASDFAHDLRATTNRDHSSVVPRSYRTGLLVATVACVVAVGFVLFNFIGGGRPREQAGHSVANHAPTNPRTSALPNPGAVPPTSEAEPNSLEVVVPGGAALERAWQGQLDQLPHELIWPGYKGGGIIGFRSDIQGYEVISEPARLIQLGALDGQPVRLGITVEQPVPNGFVGFFLGYREVDTPEGRAAQVQLVSGGRYPPLDGRLVYRVQRSISQFSPKSGFITVVKTLGYVDVDWPADSSPIRIEIDVRPDRIAGGTWGKSLLPLDGDSANERTAPEDYSGPWGIFSYRATSWFRYPSRQFLKGQL